MVVSCAWIRRGTDNKRLEWLTPVWDWTTSEEAALLLAAHLAHPEAPDIPKSLLPAIHQFTPPAEDSERMYPIESLPGAPGRDIGDWVFEDGNAATHLIRNALAGMGWDRDVRRRVLSMREGYTRGIRDDTTVVWVLCFRCPLGHVTEGSVMRFGDEEV